MDVGWGRLRRPRCLVISPGNETPSAIGGDCLAMGAHSHHLATAAPTPIAALASPWSPTLTLPGNEAPSVTPTQGRSKRPHPSQHHSRPYADDTFDQRYLTKYIPLKARLALVIVSLVQITNS